MCFEKKSNSLYLRGIINHKSIKMKKIILLSLLVGLQFSCNQTTHENSKMDIAMTVYNQNAKVVHALFDSLENEDLETAASFFEEGAKFNPPVYGGKDLDKKGIF